jgi:hypothetical protein
MEKVNIDTRGVLWEDMENRGGFATGQPILLETSMEDNDNYAVEKVLLKIQSTNKWY